MSAPMVTGGISTSSRAGAANLAPQVAKNAASTFLRAAVQAGNIIILTPLILKNLGTHDFGEWSLIYVFVPYSALFDLGISGALTQYVAQWDPAISPERIRCLFRSALVLMVLPLFF